MTEKSFSKTFPGIVAKTGKRREARNGKTFRDKKLKSWIDRWIVEHRKQCDQMAKFLCHFWQFRTMINCPKVQFFARVVLKVCQMLKKAVLNGLRLYFLPK